MRSHVFWGLSALFVVGASFAAQARTVNLFCDLPASQGELNGNVVNIPAGKWDLTICEGCPVFAPRDDLKAYYSKNQIKPAVWHITDTQYIAGEDMADQNGALVGHIVFVVHRVDATFEYTYKSFNGAKAVSVGQCKLSKPAV
jgi:hypothetical protein